MAADRHDRRGLYQPHASEDTPVLIATNGLNARAPYAGLVLLADHVAFSASFRAKEAA